MPRLELPPIADGDLATWAAVPGPSSYTAVLDLAAADEDTSYVQSVAPSPAAFTIRPASDAGPNHGVVFPASPATRWDKVDELVADGNTTYIGFVSTTGINSFLLLSSDLAALPVTGMIEDVTVHWNQRGSMHDPDTETPDIAQAGLLSQNVAGWGPLTELPLQTYLNRTVVFAADPFDGQPWTKAKLQHPIFQVRHNHSALTTAPTKNSRLTRLVLVVNAITAPNTVLLKFHAPPDLPQPLGLISWVGVSARLRKIAGGDPLIGARIRSASVDSDLPEMTIASESYADFAPEDTGWRLYADPATGAPWTPAAALACQAGLFTYRPAGSACRCTRLRKAIQCDLLVRRNAVRGPQPQRESA